MRIKNPEPSAIKYCATEAEEQAALFEWAFVMTTKYPELALMYAIPNAGKRGRYAQAQMLQTGLRAGVPDICLPVPRGGFGACYVEMKRKGRKPTEKQGDWIERLRAAGNCVGVIYSWDDAKDFILYYLNLRTPLIRREGT
jgi:hypothetical protein